MQRIAVSGTTAVLSLLGCSLPQAASPSLWADYCNIVTGVKSPANAMFEARLQTGAAPSTGPLSDPLVFPQGLISVPKSLIINSI